ncbi:MAG TPA: DUF362 domain-containing protein [Anaerolineae bacterium]|nr:DUF362 domain-containing protein [Anaerolineae bacterium]HQI84410.1 DUF362 domain-containing protein [Anaerolineae bacterium]
MVTTVALIQGNDRYANVRAALDLIADDITFDGRRQVLIKPNFVSHRQLAATHNDAMRAVLDFVRGRYGGRLIVAEGAALVNTWQSFAHFGYEALVAPYDVTLVDLNADDTVPLQVYDRHWKPRTLRLARTVVESDLRISVGPPKTHDTGIVTLSIKNMVMGSLINPMVAARVPARRESLSSLDKLTPQWLRFSALADWAMERMAEHNLSDKFAMHQGYPVFNLNMAMLAPWVWPNVAVIDGFEAMEGAGPTKGDPVDWRVALAGTDALAVDAFTARLMGFNPDEIGYMHHCQRLGLGVADFADITTVGNVEPDAVRRQFIPHPGYRRQLKWHSETANRLLRKAPQANP